eukprot:10372837-Ditylum_brightwellii.AAC.1
MTQKAGKLVGLNVTVDRSPKGHPEIAGEGIDYTWASAKYYLHTVPNRKRKLHSSFWYRLDLHWQQTKGH